MSSTASRVCVIIAARNAARTIPAAIASALREPEAAEVVVVDDASTDDTAEVARAADDGSGRLKVMREAPARVLMEALWNAGANVQAYDPEAMQECQAIYGLRDDLLLCGTKEAALRGADALLIATEWKSFRAPSFDALKDALTTPVIFDGRNLYDPKVIARYGIEYFSIGRMAA